MSLFDRLKRKLKRDKETETVERTKDAITTSTEKPKPETRGRDTEIHKRECQVKNKQKDEKSKIPFIQKPTPDPFSEKVIAFAVHGLDVGESLGERNQARPSDPVQGQSSLSSWSRLWK